MNNIPTAKDIWHSRNPQHEFNLDIGEDMFEKTMEMCMIEFAKLHVKAQVEAIAENSKIQIKEINDNTGLVIDTYTKDDYSFFSYDSNGLDIDYRITVDKNSILNAYPIKLIK